MAKKVYFFGKTKTEGSAKDKVLLGGKGANLAEMTLLDIPVPPGFTITTDTCAEYYTHGETMPEGLAEEIQHNLALLERMTGKKFGDEKNPLLVSVRSGAAVSMPGMMDTVLNLGLNDKAVEGLAEKSGNKRFALDAYRRFINMYGNVVLGMSHSNFEHEMGALKKAKGVDLDTELDADALAELVQRYKAIVRKKTNKDFPQDPLDQLNGAILAVFGSWNNERAIKYRKINNIIGLTGTAVNVQAMVFGNFGDGSGTGVCFSRDASTGENYFYGEFLMNAQGEDVVAGIRTPDPLSKLEQVQPKQYAELVAIKNQLEKHYRDMQDIEFTIEEEVLYILQTRNAKRTGRASVQIAVDMVSEGLISKEEAILRVSSDHLDQLFHPMIDAKRRKEFSVIAKGLNASPGAATGQVVFSAEDAERWVEQGKKVLLVRQETSPEDIGGMNVAQGILTATGGMTSHAAVVARGMGRPCVVGCRELHIEGKTLTIGGQSFNEGDAFTIDGNTGEVFIGVLPLEEPKVSEELNTVLAWADEYRKKSPRKDKAEFNVRANADTKDQASRALSLGAEGIGLCRTEHMFFDADRIIHFRRMIVASSLEDRIEALNTLLVYQQKDFTDIFESMAGLPVTIRLLDPPLHEFLPQDEKQIKELADLVGITVNALEAKIASLHEMNPMLGHRGCRLGITYPEIYDMQVRAIIQAALAVHRKGLGVLPEIMIPLVGTVEELGILRARAEGIVKEVLGTYSDAIAYKIGTMIEIPRAALTADSIAEQADFFSFGTNDLTQLTYGYSRDDINSFLPSYIEKGILPEDPFQTLDASGVGELIQIGFKKGRSVNKTLKVGICGEHGGDAQSIEFVYGIGFDYVSCSPLRVPQARLVAGQSVIKDLKSK